MITPGPTAWNADALGRQLRAMVAGHAFETKDLGAAIDRRPGPAAVAPATEARLMIEPGRFSSDAARRPVSH